MSARPLARKLFVAALLIWPMVHMVLSYSGRFSAWRFGGWGMYATPYPSPTQHPISVLVEFAEPGCDNSASRPATVLVGGNDAGPWLGAHVGLRFFVRCATPSMARLQLGQVDVLARLAEEAKAARQLDRAEHLAALSRLVEEQLTASATAPRRLWVSIGDLRANPLDEKYGVEDRVFAYTGKIEPVAVLFSEGQ